MSIKIETYMSYELIDNHFTPRVRQWKVYDQQSFNITIFTEDTIISSAVQSPCFLPQIPDKFSVMQYNITSFIAEQIEQKLNSGQDVALSYNSVISISSNIKWHTNSSLTIKSGDSVVLDQDIAIVNYGAGTLNIFAGLEGKDSATVQFSDSTIIKMSNGGKTKIFYNPSKGKREHKYHNPIDFNGLFSESSSYETFMLVNSVEDLQNIRLFRSGNYALSHNIDGNVLEYFVPIGSLGKPFSGFFDGNNFQISNLNISTEEFAGIFGFVEGSEVQPATISNLKVSDIHVSGNMYVGLITGAAKFTDIEQVTFYQNNTISAKQIAGGILGSGDSVTLRNIKFVHPTTFIKDGEYQSTIAGVLSDSFVKDVSCTTSECIGYSENNSGEYSWL